MAVRHFDVVVAGGTPAGIAAAIAAARRGMRVALVARDRTLGGILTQAMVTQWDLQNAPNGADLQSELFHEFYAALPDGFSPATAAAYFRKRIEEQHRIVWFAGAQAVHVNEMRDERQRHLTSLQFTVRGNVHESTSGLCFIDATDNADVAAAAGAPYDVGEQDAGRDLAMQPATLIFTLERVDWPRANPQGGTQLGGYSSLLHTYKPLSSRAIVPDANFQLNADGTVMVNAVDILGVDGRREQSLRAARAIAEAESRSLTVFFRAHLPGFERARIARFAPEIYVRETRHVRGLTWIDGRYIWRGERPYDTVALAAYPIDVHPVRRGAHGGDGWLEIPREYGIPLRALVAYGFGNLAVVGPSISATHTASGSVRVTPTTIAEGEAAGETCAQSVARRESLQQIALSRALLRPLQRELAVRR